MNKKQKIKRIEELLMGYHIDSGLNPSKKAAKINKDYFLAEVTRVVTKKSKVTTPKTPNQGKPFRTTFDTYYIWDEYPQQIFFEGRYIRYGLTYTGEWFCSTEAYPRPISSLMRVATDEEILKRLSAYANSIGIKAGVTFKDIAIDLSIKIEDKCCRGFEYNTKFNSLLFNGWEVMKDGKWVTVAKQSETPTTYIKHNKK
tara:strand:+ start:22 stop:621 length:600 start_codon:yes stop_codon:yes gene_type:complete